jgi:acyl-CoA thioester hydrolase
MNPHPPSIPTDGRHLYSIRIYYEDTDAGGIVYHANYLRFAERARTEALRAMGIPHAAMVERFGAMFVVRRIEVDYQRAARLDDSLTVVTESMEVGGASLVLRQDVRGETGSCAVLTVRLACVRLGDNKPGRIPPGWRAALTAMRDARQSRDSGEMGAATGGAQ